MVIVGGSCIGVNQLLSGSQLTPHVIVIGAALGPNTPAFCGQLLFDSQ